MGIAKGKPHRKFTQEEKLAYIAECKQSSKVHTFSPANAHFFSASFLAGNGLVVS